MFSSSSELLKLIFLFNLKMVNFVMDKGEELLINLPYV